MKVRSASVAICVRIPDRLVILGFGGTSLQKPVLPQMNAALLLGDGNDWVSHLLGKSRQMSYIKPRRMDLTFFTQLSIIFGISRSDRSQIPC